MDKPELADFLRSRRERLQPSHVGLPTGPRRRTPGLRREEVAQLAHISTEYYTRLEQARGPHPSRRVLAGIVRALRLSDAERDHLYHLAGEPPGPPPGPPREVRQSILDLIDRLPQAAAIVLDATYEVIAWNALAAALLEDFSALAPRERNLIRRHFLHPDPAQRHYGLSGEEVFGLFAAGHLRATAARYPDDPGIRALVDELASGSDEFARLWTSHQVRTARHLHKTIHHPVVGPITLNCDVLVVPDQDQHVVIFTAEPGSPSDQALQLLSVLGTQNMDIDT
ncbi:helix-turn-helix transcriptional regulator [Streptomyces sp. NBC_01275]|uniref:helix-turn-helix transcriptional regulator n=1 Tax=Streptomyces sp. NBC_01275 TaxID=2903807 RepID=UPI00225646D2|nr:helix-turn-helix transcriptional regulator [Streptomyces sp. NBC_01275]MCX4767278.1 helix-turn-helix transcriptional regulator [Streptomyces sp. NBC_01275]